ncbi:putative manganese-dependent inorganic diphosphatase [Anaeromonas frigoriresistens]|uniref:putative manganese-dependent inorganic diphosphatase n=1 Tax=Anaeromonas frigoriresistens TaxID=2683708 RepID=UPI00207876E4|nr:putative manganese-dependent inorganic diphosphatase [Anaeromonas frigoriresistens]
MIYIFGHKNPDTDSVMSAIALSKLKNQLRLNTTPFILGEINKETEFILEYFNIEKPRVLDNVKTQIKDLNYDEVPSISTSQTILKGYRMMDSKDIRTLSILDEKGRLSGIVTMKDIAMSSIKGDFYYLKTDFKSIIEDLGGKILTGEDREVKGRISVISYYPDTIKEEKILNENSIVIVGDRYDVIEYSIDIGVELIIISGGRKLPSKYINKAKDKNISIITVETDTYTTSKLINQCNYITSIMRNEDIIKFHEEDYLDDVREIMATNRHSNYPVVGDENRFLGFIGRRHILNPNRKNVILVDHNEYGQSINGLEEANILEIVDHHKIGDISTNTPISFRNTPVGSTCTIVFNMFNEFNVDLDIKTAGILISGIISDTLYLKSPTTTEIDKRAVKELNKILNMDIDKYAMNMFKEGTSLEGQSIEDIVFKDFKDFNLYGNKVGVGQVFTLDIDKIFSRKDEFLEFISTIHNNRGYSLTLILITDILKEGSYLLYSSDINNLISTAFEVSKEQGVFVEGIVSRKKQIIPRIIEAINILG